MAEEKEEKFIFYLLILVLGVSVVLRMLDVGLKDLHDEAARFIPLHLGGLTKTFVSAASQGTAWPGTVWY